MKNVIFCLIILFTANVVIAQHNREEIKEKIEAKKIAFLTERLDLTPETSQQFWPLYNAYNEATEELHKSHRASMQDASAEAKLETLIDMEQEKLDLKKEYISRFKAVLGADKTLDFFHFDMEFKSRMLREIGEKRTRMRSRGR